MAVISFAVWAVSTLGLMVARTVNTSPGLTVTESGLKLIDVFGAASAGNGKKKKDNIINNPVMIVFFADVLFDTIIFIRRDLNHIYRFFRLVSSLPILI